jgi:hypothetical protein
MSIKYTVKVVCPSVREPSKAEWKATNFFLVPIKSQTTKAVQAMRWLEHLRAQPPKKPASNEVARASASTTALVAGTGNAAPTSPC